MTVPANKPLDKVERDYIESILSTTNHNVSQAARTLGISRSTLRRKLDANKRDGGAASR